MFGGLGFLLGGNLAVCASHDGGLLVRTDGSDADQLLAQEHVEPMVMGGRSRAPGCGWTRRRCIAPTSWGTG